MHRRCIGESYQRELIAGRLVYECFRTTHDRREELDVSPSAWGMALRLIAEFGAGEWKEEYAPDVLIPDGTQWSLNIASPLLSVRSSGDNAFPPRFATVFAVIRALL